MKKKMKERAALGKRRGILMEEGGTVMEAQGIGA